MAEALTLRQLKKKEIFSLLHKEGSSPGSIVLQGISEAPLCFLSHRQGKSQGTVALLSLLEGNKDVGGIIAELSHNFQQFSYLQLNLQGPFSSQQFAPLLKTNDLTQ